MVACVGNAYELNKTNTGRDHFWGGGGVGGAGSPANILVILKITTLFSWSAAGLPVGSRMATSMLVNAELLVAVNEKLEREP